MRECDHGAVIAVAESLPEWFDETARCRSIPVDVKYQEGYVAVQDGQVVGFITLFVAEGRLNIGWVGVRRERQRKGIGSGLLSKAEEKARQMGITELATYTLGDGVDYTPYKQTRAFYFKNGLSVSQRSTTDSPSCPEEIRPVKTVPPQ